MKFLRYISPAAAAIATSRLLFKDQTYHRLRDNLHPLPDKVRAVKVILFAVFTPRWQHCISQHMQFIFQLSPVKL